MRIIGLALCIVSVIFVFFNYNIAILLFGVALLLFGGHYYQTKEKMMSYIHIISGLVFIIAIFILGFDL